RSRSRTLFAATQAVSPSPICACAAESLHSKASTSYASAPTRSQKSSGSPARLQDATLISRCPDCLSAHAGTLTIVKPSTMSPFLIGLECDCSECASLSDRAILAGAGSPIVARALQGMARRRAIKRSGGPTAILRVNRSHMPAPANDVAPASEPSLQEAA